jgi:hypothetical protein
MAYANTITPLTMAPNEFILQISETECGPADECVIDGDVIGLNLIRGRVTRQTCVRGAGAAVTHAPVLESVWELGGARQVICQSEVDPNSRVDVQGVAQFYTYDNVLYHRSTPNAGTPDFETIYFIEVGE